tara:strand:+ start:347 stop:571 length:225 start_codon:yes stop_codon:yes gene_type:complete
MKLLLLFGILTVKCSLYLWCAESIPLDQTAVVSEFRQNADIKEDDLLSHDELPVGVCISVFVNVVNIVMLSLCF